MLAYERDLIKGCPTTTTAEAFQNAIRLLERECHLIKSVDASDSVVSIAVEKFRQHMHQLSEADYRVVGLADIVKCIVTVEPS